MLEKDVKEQINIALKAGDKIEVSVLRMLLSEIKNKRIEERVDDLPEEGVNALMQKMAKRHKESIEKFKEGERDDLVEKETSELAILEKYLPEQISEEELKKIVYEAIARTGASSMKDMGRVMSDVMAQVKGRADGSAISRIAKEKLG